MTHQFVAVGDVHLRSTSSRNAARLKALDQIIDEGLALPRLAAWLLLGDIFDARSGVDDRNALASRLLRMADRAPVAAVYGNHCSPGDLDVFEKLAARWPITIAASPVVGAVTLATGGVAAIAQVPYPHKAGLVAAGVTANATLQAGADCLEAIMRGLAAELSDAQTRGQLPLFMAHASVDGAVASTGQPQVGIEISLTRAMLDLFGSVPKLLGHIHKHQQIGDAWYAGSISPCDWGEREEKVWLLVEYSDDGTFRVLPRHVDTPSLWHVDGDLTRTGFVLSESALAVEGLERRYHAGDWAGCEVRVRFRVAASDRQLVDESLVRAPFLAASRLEVEPVVIPDRALRAPEVATAKTLAEKLDAWVRLDGGQRSVPASVLQKLAALEQGDSQQTLSVVATQAAALEKGEKREEVAA